MTYPRSPPLIGERYQKTNSILAKTPSRFKVFTLRKPKNKQNFKVINLKIQFARLQNYQQNNADKLTHRWV